MLPSIQAQAYNKFCATLVGTGFYGHMLIKGTDTSGSTYNSDDTHPANDIYHNGTECETLPAGRQFKTIRVYFHASGGETTTCAKGYGGPYDFNATGTGTLNFNTWGTTEYALCRIKT